MPQPRMQMRPVLGVKPICIGIAELADKGQGGEIEKAAPIAAKMGRIAQSVINILQE